MVYGLAIGSPPVVVANVIVGVAAVYTSLRAALGKNATGTELVQGHKGKEDSGVRKLSRMLERIARLSCVRDRQREAFDLHAAYLHDRMVRRTNRFSGAMKWH